MKRNSGNDEIAIGSDSFLDIIANFVGILIILIVIAGLRVSNAPIALNIPTQQTDTETAPLQDEVPPPPVEEEFPESTSFEADEFLFTEPVFSEEPVDTEPIEQQQDFFEDEQPVVETPSPPRQPSPALLKIVASLEAELDRIDIETRSSARELRQSQSRQQEMKLHLESIRKKLAVKNSNLAKSTNRVRGLRAAVEQETQQYRNLSVELERTKSEKPPATEIKHKLTPISQTVRGKEVHFQIRKGRVANVPLGELLKRLRSQALKQQRWLVKYRSHQGEVGPIRGFVMKFVVERQPVTVVDELRNGNGTIKIGVNEWKIEPQPDAPFESLREALQPGSDFQRALYSVDADSTLTFWVYPDGFEAFRKLQQRAHAEGFTVAARPLPFGVPIAGSPHGTRSAGQ